LHFPKASNNLARAFLFYNLGMGREGHITTDGAAGALGVTRQREPVQGGRSKA